jgi:hypothetical protein
MTFSHGNIEVENVEHVLTMGGPLTTAGGLMLLTLFTLGNAPAGDVEDVLHDGLAYSWATLDSWISAGEVVVGEELSVIRRDS